MKKVISMVTMSLIMMLGLSALDYGAQGAEGKTDFTLEEMFLYALQDEHLAYAEYTAIMDSLDVVRPYANIARAEETHIAYVEDLYAERGWPLPVIEGDYPVVLPSTLQEAAGIGIKAEVDNIAMYEKFLKQDLPESVRDVFTRLRDSSENHLAAFERLLGSTAQLAQSRPGRGRR